MTAALDVTDRGEGFASFKSGLFCVIMNAPSMAPDTLAMGVATPYTRWIDTKNET